MNIIHLIVTSLFAAYASAATPPATSTLPLVFFAKYNGDLIPLSGWFLGEDHAYSSVFSHGDPSAAPVEIILNGTRTYTKQDSSWMHVGVHNDGLEFSAALTPFEFEFDTDMRVLNGPFHSCDILKNNVRAIVYGEPRSPAELCVEVEIYLLHYDKKAESAVKPLPSVPLALCAKVDDTLVPLSEIHAVTESKMFIYGDSSATPIKFYSQGNNISTIYDNKKEFLDPTSLTSGPSNVPASFNLDSKWQVLNGPYYSCDVWGNQKRMLVGDGPDIPKKWCSEIEIYILPYDQIAAPKSNPVYAGEPWYFFAKYNGTFEPLSGRSIGDVFGDFSLLTHGGASHPSTEMTRENGKVFTKPYRDAVRFNEGMFVFGPTATNAPSNLHFSSSWKVLDSPFYSCDFSDLIDDGVRGIMYKIPPTAAKYCYEVEIYLLPYDRIIGTAITNVPPPPSDGTFPK